MASTDIGSPKTGSHENKPSACIFKMAFQGQQDVDNKAFRKQVNLWLIAISFPESSFPLCSGLKTRALGLGKSRSQSPRAFWSAPRHGALE